MFRLHRVHILMHHLFQLWIQDYNYSTVISQWYFRTSLSNNFDRKWLNTHLHMSPTHMAYKFQQRNY